MQMTIEEKLSRLRSSIGARGSMLVSFSGGVDSSLLAVIARGVLGNRCRCAIIAGPLIPASSVREADAIAREHDLDLEVIRTDLPRDGPVAANLPDRCYHCKKEIIRVLKARQGALGLSCIADGINLSDTGEHRPGIIASTEEGVVHPFIEAGITKEDIREIARMLGCSFAKKPSAACLASRIPYGDKLTREKLAMIETAEDFLKSEGFSQHRVRVHGALARIEVKPKDFPAIIAMRERFILALSAMGFSYVTLDLKGYRTGSMDEVLNDTERKDTRNEQ